MISKQVVLKPRIGGGVMILFTVGIILFTLFIFFLIGFITFTMFVNKATPQIYYTPCNASSGQSYREKSRRKKS